MSELVSLTSLSCDGTQVSDYYSFERTVRNTQLERLSAVDCDVPGVPEEILSQGYGENCLSQVRAHIRDLGDDPVPLSDVKLMVLGNGRIGKTQICNRLRGRAFEADADSTHGVTLSFASLPDGSGKFNLWDFGGQDIYHGTHALFLKSRAVFLLVWTAETDNAEETEHGGMLFRNRPVSWWMDFIARFGMGKNASDRRPEPAR